MSQSRVAADLHAGFAEANPEFSPAPIWWWSGDRLDADRMCWQIDQLVAQGVHNAVVLNLAPTGPAHGALSDDPEMMTPEWWAIWEALCAHSLKVGMRLWFYDQFGFSGANLQGRLAVQRPDYVGMALHRMVVDATGSGELKLPEAGVFISGTALPLTDDAISGPPTPLMLKDGVVRWSGSGQVRLMLVYGLRQGFDYHSKEACAALIDTVHGEFERRLGSYFRTSLVGSFQDELPSVPTWSVRFEDEFRARCGYDIAPLIPALWEDWGLESARLRIDYQRVRAALAEEALFKPLFDWHDERGLTFGVDQQSPARAGEPLGATDQYADYARTHRWYSAPGSDHWGDAKFHSSIAHHYARPRTWIESFHSSGWGGTLEETFDWLQPWLLAGANLYDPHAVYYSTRGGQWEWAPPSTCWRQPYWRHYKHFADAISRLCWLATRGEHVCDVAVLFPSAAVQADLFLDRAGEKARSAHNDYMDLLGSMIWFNTIKGVLPKMLRDFDVIDDDTLAAAGIEGTSLKTRAEHYRAIIVPRSFMLETKSLKTLVAFAEAGGRLIVVGALPETADRAEGEALVARLKALAAEGRVTVVEGGDNLRAGIERALKDIAPTVTGDSPTLLRKVGDVNVLFATAAPEGSATAQPMLPWAFWNYDNDLFSFPRFTSELQQKGYDFDPGRNRKESTVSISGRVGAVEQWDPLTGRSKPAATKVVGGETVVTLDFSSSPMVAVLWTAEGTQSAVPAAKSAAGKALALGDAWRSRLVPTIDNRNGDFTLPAKPGPLPVQAWILDHQENAEDDPARLGKDWIKTPVTDGLRAWQYGPAEESKMPAPLAGTAAGRLDADGWSPVAYSLSRGINQDNSHDKMLGPKARVPEMFWRIRHAKTGESVQYRTMLPVETAGRLTLALGANGTKTAWWNGAQVAPDPGGFLHMVEVDARAGLNCLEMRVTAVSDDYLAGYWALTTDRTSFERPEWLVPTDGWKAGTTITFQRKLALKGTEDVEVHFGSQGVATLIVNGTEVAMHGSFDPYEGWPNPKTMKYQLKQYLHAGDNQIEVRFTDTGGPLAMYFDGQISSVGDNRPGSFVSDAAWTATRSGKPVAIAPKAPSRHDPRWTVLRPRPHPLPRTNWLDPEQPLAGVLDIIPEPYPDRPKVAQWFSFPVPPGATKAKLPIANAGVAVFFEGKPLPVKSGAVDLPEAGREQRSLLVQAKVNDGRRGGAIWDGPVEFECGDGEIMPGSWTEKGLAFYSGGIEYEQTISIDDPAALHNLDLGKVRGTAEVEVNGKSAGVRVWSPYRFDVSGLLRPGANTIKVRIFNTLAPYLSGASPTHFVYKGQTISGMMGPVSLQ